MRNWLQQIEQLPPGMTITEIQRRIGKPYSTIRCALLASRYVPTDGRKYGQQPNRRFVPENADWSLSNVELSRKYGVSRERIRFLRTALGHPKVGKRGPKPKTKPPQCLPIKNAKSRLKIWPTNSSAFTKNTNRSTRSE